MIDEMRCEKVTAKQLKLLTDGLYQSLELTFVPHPRLTPHTNLGDV